MNPTHFTLETWELLYATHATKDLIVKQLQSDHELTPQQIRLLLQISIDGAVAQSELAQRLDIDLGNLSRLCRKLEDKNYIERARQQTDRRVVKVRLSKNGEKMLQSMEKKSKELIQPVLQDFSDEELQTMITGMRSFLKVIHHLKESCQREPEKQ